MEQEMNHITAVTVSLYGDQSSNIKVQVSVQDKQTVAVDNIFTRVCKTIGLHEMSWPYFTLVEGVLSPTRRLRRADTLHLPCPELSLYKWIFDTDQEKALQIDVVAMELLCKHAHYDITMGNLHADKETMTKLEACLDTAFHAEAQYVRLCHHIEDYNAIYCHDCLLNHNIDVFELTSQCLITLTISTRGLSCRPVNGKPKDLIPWTSIRSWSHSVDDSTLTFDFEKLGSTSTLSINSKQTNFMLAVILDIVRTLQRKNRQPSSSVIYFASDVHRDGNKMTWDNLLYEPGTENPVFELSPDTHKDFLTRDQT